MTPAGWATRLVLTDSPRRAGGVRDLLRDLLRDRFLLVAVLGSTLLRLPWLLVTPSPDEAGFALVARTWSPAPDSLYGAYFVDRPPVLVALYRLALAFGDLGPRLLACLLAAVLVVVVHRLGGRVATTVTVVLLADPGFAAWGAKGEVLGTPLAVLACLLVLRAVERDAPRLAVAAGVCACLAAGCKQSLLGGFVFAAVLMVATARTRPGPALRLAGRFALGVSVPVLVTGAWIAVTPATLGAAWYQVVAFRADASAVLAASDSSAPVERMHELVRFAVLSGLAPLLVLALATARRWAGSPYGAAVLALTATDVVGVALSGSWWQAYLVPLVPDVALLTALAVGSARSVLLSRAVAGLLGLAALASATAYGATLPARLVDPGVGPWQVGRAIGEVAAPDDTVVSLYGHPELIAASGLSSPSPHLWSLPLRTLDPDLAELRLLLFGPSAPTWVVTVLPVDSWGIDTGGRLQAVLGERYRLVSLRCGPPVWLRRDVLRAPPPVRC